MNISITQKVGIHLAGFTVQLVYSEVVDLLCYVMLGIWGSHCKSLKQEKQEKYME